MTEEAKKKSSLFAGHFGKPGNIPPPGDPIQVTTMVVDVDRISFFTGNPRRSPNEKYAEIKESIRDTGLDNPLPISRRPDDPVGHYIIYKGGNTRLRALKELWEETKDQQFLKVRCEFHPFVSDTDALIAHLRENDLRGGMTFIDRALAVQDAKTRLEAELGEVLSQRKLEAALKERGFPISHGMIVKLDYAAKLNAFIPTALKSGAGKLQIERLQKLEKAALAVWRFHGNHGNRHGIEQQFRDTVFAPALSGGDSESWTYEIAEAAVRLRVLAALPQGTDRDAVQASFKLALDGKELKLPEPTPEPEPAPAPAHTFAPQPEPAYAPLDQYSLLDRGGTSGKPAATQAPEPADDGGIRIEGGGDNMPWGSNLDDDNELEEWMPHAPQRKEVVVEGNGRWMDKVGRLRERNYQLACQLADGYVPQGSQSISQLNVGYGFILHDVFSPEYTAPLWERLNGADNEKYSNEEKHEANLVLMHAANLWWFLVEVSATFVDDHAPRSSCPTELLEQHVPADSVLRNPAILQKVHPILHPKFRGWGWWQKLPDKQLEWAFELIRNTNSIIAAVLGHSKETGNASTWELIA
ncbi:MAG: hypothetical protein PHE17_15050 [Thiothrix sp.]|uniref:ParB family protein n=1 Tax=Thiothrix sp. TaxID=1032 RepID=UPI00262BB0EC|nr:ParB family protein [Thiothrix sp.]MDD5394330.1 hypothetical protein [Thiothrix sp.]